MKKQLEGDDKRTVLRFHPALAPVKAAFYLYRKNFRKVQRKFMLNFVNISSFNTMSHNRSVERYRRQDEIGTPFCITYDFDSEEDHQVTVRHRDSMEQIRMPIVEVKDYIAKHLEF